MTTKVNVLEDSINPHNGVRLTTMELRYWRAFHSEFMTHRVFSRNASSSRAIPISKVIKQVWDDPAGPTHWGANQPGMKARTELTGFRRSFAINTWKFTSRLVCSIVWTANKIAKPHKQIFNRLLEPWQYISVIVSGTEWDNFFELRDHPDAQPEFGVLARQMKLAREASNPCVREFHLPYIHEYEREIHTPELCMKLSTARCARVSYLTHDGKKPSVEKDLELYDKLVGSVPIHASPTEHAAQAMVENKYYKNFRGWKQHRVTVEDNLRGINADNKIY